MNIRHRLLLAITSLFLVNTVFARDVASHLIVTNAGQVTMTITTEDKSHNEEKKTEVYRDQLISEIATNAENESVASSVDEEGK